jgi:hypothetical protein
MHKALADEGYKSAKLLQVYKSIAANYCANTLLIDNDNDEEVLIFELQKFLNTAIALLLIDSERTVFTSSLYEQLNTYFTTTDKASILVKVEACITRFSENLSVLTKGYLRDINLLDFVELKGIINQQEDISIYIQEILELPITVANELNDDFDGGYDFHADDEDDIAYLRPDAS